MNEKSQNINPWQFKEIFAALVLILAIMLLYLGLTQFFNIDAYGLYYLTISQIVFYLAMAIAVFYLAIFKKGNTFSQFLGIQDLSKSLFWGAIGFILLVCVTTLIDLITEKFLGIKSSDVYSDISPNFLLAMSTIGVVAAPFSEEIFFRGFLQPVFIKKFGKILGIFCVCSIFALSHVIYIENIAAFLEIIFVGIILSVIKETSNSLIPCMIAHFLNNLLATWIMFFH